MIFGFPFANDRKVVFPREFLPFCRLEMVFIKQSPNTNASTFLRAPHISFSFDVLFSHHIVPAGDCATDLDMPLLPCPNYGKRMVVDLKRFNLPSCSIWDWMAKCSYLPRGCHQFLLSFHAADSYHKMDCGWLHQSQGGSFFETFSNSTQTGYCSLWTAACSMKYLKLNSSRLKVPSRVHTPRTGLKRISFIW